MLCPPDGDAVPRRRGYCAPKWGCCAAEKGVPRHGEGDAVFLTKGVLCPRDGGAVPQKWGCCAPETGVLCPRKRWCCAPKKWSTVPWRRGCCASASSVLGERCQGCCSSGAEQRCRARSSPRFWGPAVGSVCPAQGSGSAGGRGSEPRSRRVPAAAFAAAAAGGQAFFIKLLRFWENLIFNNVT